ncbi:cellulase family glycosylhydrolase [Anaerosporobacter sp.]|uniref:cellulase family glycosylhydrolase n=1 Tax=Anaerosporobacter sp. TaxID=1872529 RepID=UPI00286EE1D9|nr:cellulase family glycosylhydrolase [Anaerosporobacter sp.]
MNKKRNTKRFSLFVLLFFAIWAVSLLIDYRSSTTNSNQNIDNTPTLTANLTSTLTSTLPSQMATGTAITTNSTINSKDTIKKNSYYGKLQVKGTQLCDKKGNPVQLKGLSTHGLGWFPEYVTKKTFKTFRDDWNMNVIRLAMYTEEYNGYCSSNSTQKKNLKKIVNVGIKAAIELDMYVIVDWHILSDGNPLTHVDEAKAFFKEISAKYKNDPHIIYEICNEPNGGTSWSDIKKYAKKVIPVIRKNAPDAIIIVGTPTWSQDVDVASKSPITGYDNIMYALHFYAGTHKDDLRNKMTTAIKNKLPIFVSEYGISDASGNGGVYTKEANKWITFMDKNNVSYVAWNLSNKAESSSILTSSCKKVSGFTSKDLSASGKWLKSTLTKTTSTSTTSTTTSTDTKKDTSSTTSSTDTQKDTSTTTSSTDTKKDTTTSTTSTTTETTTKITADYKNVIESFQISDSLKPTIVLDSSWEDSDANYYLFRVSLKNTTSKALSTWSFKLNAKKKVELVDCWNCNVKGSKSKVLTVTPTDQNKKISSKSTLSDLGMIIKVAK